MFKAKLSFLCKSFLLHFLFFFLVWELSRSKFRNLTQILVKHVNIGVKLFNGIPVDHFNYIWISILLSVHWTSNVMCNIQVNINQSMQIFICSTVFPVRILWTNNITCGKLFLCCVYKQSFVYLTLYEKYMKKKKTFQGEFFF